MREITLQATHGIGKLLLGHAVVLNYHAHIATGVKGIVLVTDAVLAVELGHLAQADYILVLAVGPTLQQPVHLVLLALGLVFLYQRPETVAVALIEAGDDAQVLDLLVAKLAMGAINLGEDVAGIDKEYLVPVRALLVEGPPGVPTRRQKPRLCR